MELISILNNIEQTKRRLKEAYDEGYETAKQDIFTIFDKRCHHHISEWLEKELKAKK